MRESASERFTPAAEVFCTVVSPTVSGPFTSCRSTPWLMSSPDWLIEATEASSRSMAVSRMSSAVPVWAVTCPASAVTVKSLPPRTCTASPSEKTARLS